MQSAFTGLEPRYLHWSQAHKLLWVFFEELGLEIQCPWKLEPWFIANYPQTFRCHYGKNLFPPVGNRGRLLSQQGLHWKEDGSRTTYNMIFARTEVWQEGKGEALICKHKAAKIRPRNAQLLQKKMRNLLNVSGLFPDLINHKCNNAQRNAFIVILV